MKEEIIKVDNTYDEAIFLSRVDHIFIMILDAIMGRDMSSVKHYLTDEVYERYNDLVNSYINDKKIRLFDEMNVKSTTIENVNITDTEINIEVILTSRYMDYFMDEDGNYISGINDHRIEKNHYITFTKNIGAKELKSARRCPSCGATLDINHSGVCPYCKSTIDMSNYDYIITRIDTI